MESNQPKIGKFSLNYGLLLGGIGVVFGVMLYLQDMHTSQSPAVMAIGLVLAAVVTYLGVTNFKKQNDGALTLGQAVKIGAGIALIAGIISVLYNIVLVEVIDLNAKSDIMDARLGPALESGEITQQQFEQQKEQSINFWWMGYPFIIIINVLIGLVLGLIFGLIFKKAKPSY